MNDPNIKKNLVRSGSIEQVGEDCEQVENLTLTEFSKKLEALEIIVDIDTTSRLFNALTLGKNSTLSCVSFQIFVDTYQAKEDELQKVNQRNGLFPTGGYFLLMIFFKSNFNDFQ